ncbi:AMP-binding enzyme [Vreelandella sulfidaeris]|uniref:AMP-binding enzyme n=1 Tax=Vreelandella sulfidaeris TaxID=115553 RepID=UPI0030842452
MVVKEGQSVSEEELIHHAKTLMAPYKVPKHIIFTDALPKSTAGKILKRHLRQDIKE